MRVTFRDPRHCEAPNSVRDPAPMVATVVVVATCGRDEIEAVTIGPEALVPPPPLVGRTRWRQRAQLPYSWRDVESLPDLERLRLTLETLPDDDIVAALEAARGRGRNDYPVSAMWRALIAGIVFQHASI